MRKAAFLLRKSFSKTLRFPFRAIVWNPDKFHYCYVNHNLLSVFLTCVWLYPFACQNLLIFSQNICKIKRFLSEIYYCKPLSHQSPYLSRSLPVAYKSHKAHPLHPCKCLFEDLNCHPYELFDSRCSHNPGYKILDCDILWKSREDLVGKLGDFI